MIAIERIGSAEVIDINFPLNEDSAGKLGEAIDSLGYSASSVVLNLSETPLINGKGLEYLLSLQEDCLAQGGALKIASPAKLCADILEITGLNDSIESYPSVIEAVGSFSQ